MIEDLNSVNGIKVNGVKVEKSLLKKGDRISIGKLTFDIIEII